MPAEMPNATTMESNEGLTVISMPSVNMGSTRLAAMLTMYPSTMPRAPPRAEVVAASVTNWARMTRSLAPRALRMPISFVRSVTDTSMMFMMPMPPTSSEMLAMPVRMTMTMLIILFISSSHSLAE